MKVYPPERHMKPSQRLLVAVAFLAAFVSASAWSVLGPKGLWLSGAFLPIFAVLLRYVSGSWVRISPHRGLSYCLKGLNGTAMGSVALDASEIAELRLESSQGARLLGLWNLQVIKRDGTALPVFRFFGNMDQVAEEIHRFLQQA